MGMDTDNDSDKESRTVQEKRLRELSNMGKRRRSHKNRTPKRRNGGRGIRENRRRT